MKQYCRYCAHCFEGDGFGCSDHPKGEQPHWTEEQIKRANRCPNFALTEDIIIGREYKPREYKPREHKPEQPQESYNQLTF